MHSKTFNLDKLYTKDNVALFCTKMLDLSQFDLIIEPSAGAGAFIRAINYCAYKGKILAMDIQPEENTILIQDWLTFDISKLSKYKKILIIGNPPFGKRNKLSMSFIQKACSIPNVDTIAFILPSVYNKHTNQQKIPLQFNLSNITTLNPESFEYENQPYKIPTCFFVFSKSSKTNLRMDPSIYVESKHFFYGKKDDYDFFVMGAAPHVTKSAPEPNNRGYYIKVKSGFSIQKVINNFKKIPWKNYGNSSASGGVSWFTKAELIMNYDNATNSQNFL